MGTVVWMEGQTACIVSFPIIANILDLNTTQKKKEIKFKEIKKKR